MLIKILIGAILSGILYRLGGWEKGNTKFRDLGCPTILTLFVLTNNLPINILGWVMFVLSFGLMLGALTTYWDWLFGYDNYYAHGLGCGLAGIPLIWAGIPLHYILIRILICSVGMGLWSKYTKNDVVEEIGRGVLFII
jgi:hypothetical protein